MGGAGKEATRATLTGQEERVKILNGSVEENVNQSGEVACWAATLGSQQAAGAQLRELSANGMGCTSYHEQSGTEQVCRKQVAHK